MDYRESSIERLVHRLLQSSRRESMVVGSSGKSDEHLYLRVYVEGSG